MKKILLVANVAKEHVLKFHIPTIKMLTENGWIVDVACHGKEKIPYCSSQFNMSYERNPFRIATIKGIFELKRIIAKGEYDIIYCHTPVGGLVARIAGRLFCKNRCKIIYFAHGFHFYKGAPILNWLVYYPVEWFLARYTDLIITINKEDYLIAKENFKTCDVSLLNGVGIDLSKFVIDNKDEIRMNYRKNLNIPYDAKVLIYVAELSRNKNQLMLLQVLKKIYETHENIYLVLAGIDHSNGVIQKKASELVLTKYVRLLGWRADVANLYVMSDVCVATSLREGLPINIIEAMAANIPVVATNNRGHAAIINNGVNGFLVDINDDLAMANAVVKMVDDDELREKIIRNAKNDLPKYENKEILSKLKIILDNYCCSVIKK